MAKEQTPAAKIRDGIRARLAAEERSIRWLSRRTGIKYPTLQSKLANFPGRLNSDELGLIADAFEIEIGDLARAAA